ncbi:PAS domain S-box protein [Thioalkalivibrio sp. ALMg13-2]|uniref:PAS domain S-box protein n=1 Tax=Thioalkalivibrio sp. ALMg13-2 TaxID=1158167 RepID=UPI000381061F|nr:PAS domain S-box protein [Thioalkalivibrio sp. ALMg13-2]
MTPGWGETSLGLIFQVYALAFFVLGIAALHGMRRERGSGLAPHLGWLAAFGVLHGLQGFIDGERLRDPAPGLAVLSAVLMVSSFAALLEFGRRLWNERPGGRRLAALPLFAVTGLGIGAVMWVAPAAAAGLELGTRYLLGAPAAALAGIGLLSLAGGTTRAQDTFARIRWLRIAALAMLGYAALTLLPSPASGRLLAEWLPTTADFLAASGWPVQLVHAALAVLLAAGFVILNRQGDTLAATTLRRVTDNLDGFVYRCRNDRDWTVTFMSEGGENLTGYPAADFQRGARHFADQIYPDDQECVWNEVQAALAQRVEFRLQYRMLDRAGRVRWCYEEGRGHFDARGELLYLEGLVRNDDERHRAEDARRRMQALVEGAPEAVGWADPDGTVLYFNRAFRNLLAMPEDADPSDGYRVQSFYDNEVFAFLEATVLPTVATSGQWTGELALKALDGRYIPTLNSVFALPGEAGEAEVIANVITDLTELKRAEAALAESESRYRQLFELSTDGIAYADTESTSLVSANLSFANMLGYAQAEIAQLSVRDIYPPDDLSWVLEQFSELASGHQAVARDVPVLRRDGSVFYADISASWVTVSGRSLMVGVFRDVSQRRIEAQRIQDLNETLEARVLERTADLERANAAKNEFLSRMSHELRTPLNAILGFTQVLQLPGGAPLSTQQADNVREIHHAGEHLLGLVNEVLDLARIEAGQLEIAPEPVALVPVLEHAVAQIEMRARERDIPLTLQAHEPSTVLADPLRLRQVLLNLLSNAVKYNRDGGQIDVGCEPATDGRVRVSVRDTGHGLSTEQQARLFRPFERLESAYEGIEGTGIGLALAKQLVEGMQGSIGVDSVPGEGSTFWFELPLSDDRADMDHDTPASTSKPDPATQGKSQTILYIEDNPANLRLVQKILDRRADIELLSVENAEDGLVLAGQERPDLILLDLNLPGMDGFEALQRMRADPVTRAIPVIAVSANAMKRDIERGMAAGFQDYLVKPINVRDLYIAIDTHLASPKRTS